MRIVRVHWRGLAESLQLGGLIEVGIAGEVELLLMPPIRVIGHVEVILVIRCKRRLAPIEAREGHAGLRLGDPKLGVRVSSIDGRLIESRRRCHVTGGQDH